MKILTNSHIVRRVGNWRRRSKAGSPLPEITAIACFLLFIWTVIAAGLRHQYNEAEVSAVASTSNLTRAFEESTRRTISQVDQILRSGRAFRTAQGDRFNFNEWALTQTLTDKMTAQISMTNAAGDVVASTVPMTARVNVADRAHIKVHTETRQDLLFISKPVTGRVSRVDTIQFTRRLLGPQGGFDGVIILSLSCAELSHFFEQLELGEGFVSLLSADGIILATGPLQAGVIGTSIANVAQLNKVLTSHAGTAVLRAEDESIEQIVSFRHLTDYPIIVMVGLGRADVFNQYRTLVKPAIVGGSITTVAIVLIGLLWVRQKRRGVASHHALTITLSNISQGILMVDGRGQIPVSNRRALDLLGLSDKPLKAALAVAVSRATQLAACSADTPAQSGSDGQFDRIMEDGKVIEVRTHRIANGGSIYTYTDVTEQRQADTHIRQLAHFDPLTGLANRVLLQRRLGEMLQQPEGLNLLNAIIMIDLDGFKGVNDTLGHNAGDELLVEVARRLRMLVREADVVARLGGDEFVILLPRLRQADDAASLATRLLARIADPVMIGEQEVRVGASIGIAFHPRDGLAADVLLKHADIALYSAKDAGRGVFRCFGQELNLVVNENRMLESDLRRALEGSELEVYFQPKFECETLRLVGFEALARWQHPTRGAVSPAVFIAIAEHCGLINRLGLWIIASVCRTIASWTTRYPVAVNVSVIQLRNAGLTADIMALLDETGVTPDQLEIEVTESVMLNDNQMVLGVLQTLQDNGIKIALDDFGIGYSSLNYLRRFRFDKIKIDRAFVQGQAEDDGVRVILKAILDLCNNLGLATVGEGVETQQQLTLLQEYGCSELQGYLMGHPMPGDLVPKFIQVQMLHPHNGFLDPETDIEIEVIS